MLEYFICGSSPKRLDQLPGGLRVQQRVTATRNIWVSSRLWRRLCAWGSTCARIPHYHYNESYGTGNGFLLDHVHVNFRSLVSAVSKETTCYTCRPNEPISQSLADGALKRRHLLCWQRGIFLRFPTPRAL